MLAGDLGPRDQAGGVYEGHGLSIEVAHILFNLHKSVGKNGTGDVLFLGLNLLMSAL